MATELKDFLIKIANDGQLREAYVADRDAVMKEYNLSPEDMALIKNADNKGIAKKLGANYSVAANGPNMLIDIYKIE
ncbi:MAG: hypothetical protein OEY19_05565 [Gammaproteobacteria bacterium]|nr:hypothetical protein [Gammaproteobacteria bacterium]MDH5630200.1 hypothetical protein [Gammaproteobacteria bacterium]